jgi:hypothetical protein
LGHFHPSKIDNLAIVYRREIPKEMIVRVILTEYGDGY